MIRVAPAPEPIDFEARVRSRGRAVLLELTGDPSAPVRRGRRRLKVADSIAGIASKHLPVFWRRCLPQLRMAYQHRCAYLGMRIHPATGAATVDHFRPKESNQALAYEWSNFRLASLQINANKGHHNDVIDPFAVDNGWFILDIGTFKVHPSPGLNEIRRASVEATISRLKLNEPTFCKSREEYHDLYHGLGAPRNGQAPEALPLHWLRQECPYVAYELERQGRLRDVLGAAQAAPNAGL